MWDNSYRFYLVNNNIKVFTLCFIPPSSMVAQGLFKSDCSTFLSLIHLLSFQEKLKNKVQANIVIDIYWQPKAIYFITLLVYFNLFKNVS